MFSYKKIYAAGFIGFCHKGLTLWFSVRSRRCDVGSLGLRDVHCELKKRTTRDMKILSTPDRGLSHQTSTCPLDLLHAGLA